MLEPTFLGRWALESVVQTQTSALNISYTCCYLPAVWDLPGCQVALCVVERGGAACWPPLDASRRLCMWRPMVSSAAAVVFRTSTSTWLSFSLATRKRFLKAAERFKLTHNTVMKSFLNICRVIQERIATVGYGHYFSHTENWVYFGFNLKFIFFL